MINITKSPNNPDLYTNRVQFCSSARVGFRHLLNYIDFHDDEKILLPSYIGLSINEGSGVFDPIEEIRIGYEFYKINKDFSIDEVDFINKLKYGNIKAALVVHYFGFLQSNLKRIIQICKELDILLIEDCAHTLTSKHGNKLLGDFGDFSFFSIHKILPASDGGFLKINNNAFDIPAIPIQDKISQKTLEIYARSKLDTISTIRRRNYQLLLKYLSDINCIKLLYPNLSDTIIPMNLPILLKEHNRENFYYQLIDEGVITIALYYKLIDQIDESEFPISYQISREILNLPIHQDITEQAIRYIGETIRKLLIND